MASLLCLMCAVAISFCSGISLVDTSDAPCPTWFIQSNGSCVCGDALKGKVKCNGVENPVSLLLTFCMTYSSLHNTTVVGACPFFPLQNASDGFVPIPNNLTEQCESVHREGQLCGRCLNGFAPGVLSYNHDCVNCSNWAAQQYKWLAFFGLEFALPTLLFFAMFITRTGATSGSLNGFVFFGQVFATANNLKLFSVLSTTAVGIDTSTFSTFIKVIFTLYAFLNLDFFLLFVGGYCLDAGITTVQAMAMAYIVPLYMMLLIGLTYFIIELHDRDVQVIVKCWKPFRRRFLRWRRNWQVKDSLIDTFATFLLLCYSKLATASLRLLNNAFVYNVHGKRVGAYFYYDGTVEYFGSGHAPFALLALAVLALIAILPLILTLYQFKPFHWCLEHCRLCTPRVQNGLSAFVDSYQGCYKEKYRFFAGLYFILRIVMAAADFDDTFSSRYLRHLLILLLIGMSIAFALLQPYKLKKYNVIDSLHFVVLASIYFLLLNEVFFTLLSRKSPFLPIASVLIVLPLLYLIALQLHWVLFKKGYFKKYCWKFRMQGITTDNSSETTSLFRDEADESLPDRMLHPSGYESNDTSSIKTNPAT